MKKVKKIIIVLLILVATTGIVIYVYFAKDGGDKYERPEFDTSTIPQFDKITLQFTTIFDSKVSLPIVGSAVFDIDNDGVDELLVGNGVGKEAGIFAFKNGAFINITEQVGFKKPDLNQTIYGITAVDFDNNGFTDLLVSGKNAVYFYANQNGIFSAPQNLNLSFNKKSQPASITYTDLNQDGFVDLFVSTYLHKNLMEGQTIFNKVGYGSTSELFLNNGDNTFTSITEQAGLNYVHNAFTAVFVDINNDGLPDLVVAYDTGEPRIYENKGDLKFELVIQPLTQKFSFPMGIAAGDYDNNGFQDFMFSNVGKTMPPALMRGDLTEEQELVTDWILLANQGNGTFTDDAVKSKIADYEFSWGAIFEDFNNDGLQDLVVSENYVDLPNSKIKPLPSRFLMQLPNHTFVNIESDNGTLNACNGVTPLTADFNNDGFADLVHINLDGEINAFISKANVKNNFITLRFPNTLKYAQAKVNVSRASGSKQYYQNLNGEGLASDQTRTIFIGLGQEKGLPKIEVKLSSEEIINVSVTKINCTIKL